MFEYISRSFTINTTPIWDMILDHLNSPKGQLWLLELYIHQCVRKGIPELELKGQCTKYCIEFLRHCNHGSLPEAVYTVKSEAHPTHFVTPTIETKSVNIAHGALGLVSPNPSWALRFNPGCGCNSQSNNNSILQGIASNQLDLAACGNICADGPSCNNPTYLFQAVGGYDGFANGLEKFPNGLEVFANGLLGSYICGWTSLFANGLVLHLQDL
ncbi:hypothetical protein P167DRAFT_566321 [Morchella conica CCBAS932]|uniref:Uncharacterized protein n=1 Tax=Morchella conica CCBAS932 TaxID=1392247 RepID=A0A3N4KJM2_9PEZI|nr:hypothetical protein P167DRAFT_566321 [Morchella conica CCBAS932]